jgi:hypothetical protein
MRQRFDLNILSDSRKRRRSTTMQTNPTAFQIRTKRFVGGQPGLAGALRCRAQGTPGWDQGPPRSGVLSGGLSKYPRAWAVSLRHLGIRQVVFVRTGGRLDCVYASAEHLQRVKGKFWLVAATFQLWNRSVQGAGSQPCGAAQCQRTKPRVSTKTRSA